MTRSAAVIRLAAVGAATALLWPHPAAAADQPLPGAAVEGVAIATRLHPAIAKAVSLVQVGAIARPANPMRGLAGAPRNSAAGGSP